MTRTIIDSAKLAAMNTFSWIGTIMSLEAAIQWLQVISLLGSLLVSFFSVVYLLMKIRNKSKE
jgi:hypothetical protein